jgi:phosphate transport system substrate-binding protein
MKKIFSLLFIIVLGVVLVGCKPTDKAKDDHEIKVYTRDTTSGTRDGFFSVIGFKDAVADNTVLVDGYVEVEGNGAMITSIEGDDYGIGYISLSSLLDSNLRGLLYEDVEPTEENVINGTYKLTRNFNYAIREDDESAAGQITKAFVAYMGTKEGKATIKGADGIVFTSADDPTWGSIKANYPIVEEDNSSVEVKFGGSTSVEKVAKALSSDFKGKAGNFVAVHNHTGSGDAFKRVQGTEKDGADKLDIGFASREFKLTDGETLAPGTYGKLCTDAIVVVVNEANNTLTKITAAQLKEIYEGTVTKWEELK